MTRSQCRPNKLKMLILNQETTSRKSANEMKSLIKSMTTKFSTVKLMIFLAIALSLASSYSWPGIHCQKFYLQQQQQQQQPSGNHQQHRLQIPYANSGHGARVSQHPVHAQAKSRHQNPYYTSNSDTKTNTKISNSNNLTPSQRLALEHLVRTNYHQHHHHLHNQYHYQPTQATRQAHALPIGAFSPSAAPTSANSGRMQLPIADRRVSATNSATGGQQQERDSQVEQEASLQNDINNGNNQHHNTNQNSNHEGANSGKLLVCYYTTRQSAPYWPKDAREYVISPSDAFAASALNEGIELSRAATGSGNFAPLIPYEPFVASPSTGSQAAVDFAQVGNLMLDNSNGQSNNNNPHKSQPQVLTLQNHHHQQQLIFKSADLAGVSPQLLAAKTRFSFSNYNNGSHKGKHNIGQKQQPDASLQALASEQHLSASQQQTHFSGSTSSASSHASTAGGPPTLMLSKQTPAYYVDGLDVTTAPRGHNGLIVGDFSKNSASLDDPQTHLQQQQQQQAAAPSHNGNNGNFIIGGYGDGKDNSINAKHQHKNQDSNHQEKSWMMRQQQQASARTRQQLVFSPSQLSRAFNVGGNPLVVGGGGGAGTSAVTPIGAGLSTSTSGHNEPLDTKSHLFIQSSPQAHNNYFHRQAPPPTATAASSGAAAATNSSPLYQQVAAVSGQQGKSLQISGSGEPQVAHVAVGNSGGGNSQTTQHLLHQQQQFASTGILSANPSMATTSLSPNEMRDNSYSSSSPFLESTPQQAHQLAPTNQLMVASSSSTAHHHAGQKSPTSFASLDISSGGSSNDLGTNNISILPANANLLSGLSKLQSYSSAAASGSSPTGSDAHLAGKSAVTSSYPMDLSSFLPATSPLPGNSTNGAASSNLVVASSSTLTSPSSASSTLSLSPSQQQQQSQPQQQAVGAASSQQLLAQSTGGQQHPHYQHLGANAAASNANGGLSLSSALVSSPLSTMFDVFGAASQYLMRFRPSSLISPSSFAFNSLPNDHNTNNLINQQHHHQLGQSSLGHLRASNSSSSSLLSSSSFVPLAFGSSLIQNIQKSSQSSGSSADRSAGGSGGGSGTSTPRGSFLSRLMGNQNTQRREDVCGRTIQTPERRIIGGEGARYGEFPYQVHIKIAKHQCGGALVDRQSIVTAAHCVYHFITRAPVNKLQIVIGAYDIEDEQYQELPPQYFKVNKVKLHPNFRFSASHPDRYDIAILKLDKPVKYTDNVLPVCLPSKDLKFESMIGTVTGFGKTDPSLSNRYGTRLLQKVDVPIIENNECERWHRTRGIDLKIFPEMMCAGYEDGLKDACVGDSGGPLVVKTAVGPNGSFRWTLAGITSAGFGCAQTRQPGIYHRVSHTVDWILENLD